MEWRGYLSKKAWASASFIGHPDSVLTSVANSASVSGDTIFACYNRRFPKNVWLPICIEGGGSFSCMVICKERLRMGFDAREVAPRERTTCMMLQIFLE